VRCFDTHIHLDDPALEDRRTTLWQQALDAGVCGAITIGVEPKTWQRALQTASELKNVHAAMAIHPMVVANLSPNEIDQGVERLDECARTGSILAIGECGLHGPAGNFELQIKVFEQHIALAKKSHLPLLLHVYRAHAMALSVLQKHAPIDVPIVMHSYSGSAQSLADFAHFDAYFCFASAIRNPLAKKPRGAAKAVALNRLLVETDAPFQPTRGAAHSCPIDLVSIVTELASLREMPLNALAEALLHNTTRCFPSLHDCCSCNGDGVA
jgi:TatD DNase family protein